jgi:hypothetical protein
MPFVFELQGGLDLPEDADPLVLHPQLDGGGCHPSHDGDRLRTRVILRVVDHLRKPVVADVADVVRDRPEERDDVLLPDGVFFEVGRNRDGLFQSAEDGKPVFAVAGAAFRAQQARIDESRDMPVRGLPGHREVAGDFRRQSGRQALDVSENESLDLFGVSHRHAL